MAYINLVVIITNEQNEYRISNFHMFLEVCVCVCVCVGGGGRFKIRFKPNTKVDMVY